MTTTETIWALVYAAEFERQLANLLVSGRVTTAGIGAPILTGIGASAGLAADAAVANISSVSQAVLAVRITAQKP